MAFGRRKDPEKLSAILDDIKKRGEFERFEVPLAMMVIMTAMMWADNKKDDAEDAQINSLHRLSPVFASMTDAQFQKVREDAEALVHRLDDRPARFADQEAVCRKAAASLSKELRQTAFGFALMILFADQQIAAEETVAAEALEKWLGIERNVALRIIDVVMILKRRRDTQVAA
jgi:hypothetical protein